MFEFMDDVVDAMEETGKVVVDGVVYCLICVAKLALIITAPVWALPYTIWRKGRNMFRYDAASGVNSLEVSIFYSKEFLGV